MPRKVKESSIISKIIEIGGTLLILVSLIFVYYELRQNSIIATNESFGSQSDTIINLLSFLAANTSVLGRGCMGEDLNKDEDLLFTLQVQAIDRFHFMRYRRAVNGFTGYPLLASPQWVARHRIWYPGFNIRWQSITSQAEVPLGEFYKLVNEQYELLSDEYYSGQYGPELCGIAGI